MELITSEWDPLTAEGFLEGRYDTAPVLRTHPSAPVRPHRITHAVLQTTQLKIMCDFYTVIGGLRVVSDEGGVVYLGGSLDDYEFSLVLVAGDEPLYHHASFELSGEAMLSAAETALASRGIPIAKRVDVPWKRSIYLRDPDGLMTEWYVRRATPRNLREHAGHALADVV
jgi:catechol 2,3-dioxygenase